MMRLPAFRYLAPQRLEDALRMLSEAGPAGSLVGGGTDLYPNMKRLPGKPFGGGGVAWTARIERSRFRRRRSHRWGRYHTHPADSKCQGAAGFPPDRRGRTFDFNSSAPQHGNRGRESLPGHPLPLPESVRFLAQSSRLLHESGIGHLPGGARGDSLLGNYFSRSASASELHWKRPSSSPAPGESANSH